jgi:methylphosphotriester-DNA--protein-cysteine methyltransferase
MSGTGVQILDASVRRGPTAMSVTSTLIERAETRFIEPAEALRPFVGCFWIITAARGAAIRIVPDGGTSISLELRNGHPCGWSLRGPICRPSVRRFAAPATLIGVRLRAGVAFLVTGMRADTIVGRHVRLNGSAFHALACRSCPPVAPDEYVEILQRFLIARLAGARVHDVVAGALEEIEGAQGCVRVGEIAARCGVSTRHLHRLMRTWVGYGPKRFGCVVRFQSTLTQMDRAPGRTGAALASDGGYFDQAHLTLDMARLAGDTPGHLASRRAADFYKTRCNRPL